jgi:hypothetical protein
VDCNPRSQRDFALPQYYNLGAKHPDLIEKRRRVFADNLRRYARPAAALPPGAAAGGS